MSEWISPKDKLPEEGVTVLVAVYVADWKQPCDIEIAWRENGRWKYDYILTEDANADIIGGMPLPEFPPNYKKEIERRQKNEALEQD